MPELEDRDCKNNALLEELHAVENRAAEVNRLRQENESLKVEIRRLRESRGNQVLAPNNRTVLGELSPNKTPNGQDSESGKLPFAADAADLATRYSKLYAESKELKIKHQDTVSILHDCRIKLRQRNETIEQWAKYSDTQQRKIQRLQSRLKIPRRSTDQTATVQAYEAGYTTSGDAEALNILVHKRLSPASSFDLEHPLSLPLAAEPDRLSAPASPKRTLSEPPQHFATGSAFGGPVDDAILDSTPDQMDLPPYMDNPAENSLVAVKTELSSDAPVFVSTKPVRKRKLGGEEPEGGRLRRIKSEHSSSSGPEIVSGSQHLSPVESIDFEEDVHVPTPRKRRATPQHGRGDLDVDSGSVPGPRIGDRLRQDTLRAASTLDNTPTTLHGGASPEPSSFSPSMLRDTFSHVPRSYSSVLKNKVSSESLHVSPLRLGVLDLAEDGDAGSNRPQKRPVIKGRLDALLNSSPSVIALTPINRSVSRNRQTYGPVSIPIDEATTRLPPILKLAPLDDKKIRETTTTPVMKQIPEASASPQPAVSRDRGPKKPSILRDDMPRGRAAAREDAPLRGQPIERLRPEDFKPNPKYNDGLTYVYDEVVRGKDARAALSGCTDLNCCGKTFRHFAEAERKTLGSLTTTRTENIHLMEKYLGDQAWQLGTMSPEEKDETWLLAKTWELANKFGKHRQRYSRMPTPPGFWNVDFPSTQERAEELVQAEEIRNALVSERYREAMRCDGSWLFRDEEPR